MRMFLRKSSVGRDPLVIAMSGVRLGERLLQIGIDEPKVLGALAAKVGLSGHAAVVTLDEASSDRVRAAIADASTIADVCVTTDGTLPLDDGSFDVGVVHSTNGLLASLEASRRSRLLRELRRVIRNGGRVIATEAGERTGFRARLGSPPKKDDAYEQAGGTIAAMEDAGFKPVRLLADRDGFRFIEGLKA